MKSYDWLLHCSCQPFLFMLISKEIVSQPISVSLLIEHLITFRVIYRAKLRKIK